MFESFKQLVRGVVDGKDASYHNFMIEDLANPENVLDSQLKLFYGERYFNNIKGFKFTIGHKSIINSIIDKLQALNGKPIQVQNKYFSEKPQNRQD